MYNKFFYNNNRELRGIWVAGLYFLFLPVIVLFYLVFIVVNRFEKTKTETA